MNSLTEYMRRPGKACQLPVLVDGELSRNEREVNAAVELSDAERAVLIKWIHDAHCYCIAKVSHLATRDSALGKTVKKLVYVSLRHDVDFVTLKDSGAFVCTEMKFRLKPNSYGPFSNAKLFIDKIAVKFDELESALAEDAEKFVKVRVLLVSDGHFDLLRSAIEDLKNAGDVCSSDGCRHDYLLCTLSGLFKLSANNTEAGETFKFSL